MISIENYIAIQRLCARFAVALDCSDYEAVTDLFTVDGVYESNWSAKGRENIRFGFKKNIEKRGERTLKNGLHVCSSPIIEGDDSRAFCLGHFLWVATSVRAEPVASGVNIQSGETPFSLRIGFEAGQPGIILSGMYEDEVCNVNGNWLFSRRKVHFETPGSDTLRKFW